MQLLGEVGVGPLFGTARVHVLVADDVVVVVRSTSLVVSGCWLAEKSENGCSGERCSPSKSSIRASNGLSSNSCDCSILFDSQKSCYSSGVPTHHYSGPVWELFHTARLICTLIDAF